MNLTPKEFQLLETDSSKKALKIKNKKFEDAVLQLFLGKFSLTPFFTNYILKMKFVFNNSVEKTSSNGFKHVINIDWFNELEDVNALFTIFQLTHAETHLAVSRSALYTQKELWQYAVFISITASWNGLQNNFSINNSKEPAYFAIDEKVDYILFDWDIKDQSYENIYKELLKIQDKDPSAFDDVKQSIREGARPSDQQGNSTGAGGEAGKQVSPTEMVDPAMSALEKELAEQQIRQTVKDTQNNAQSTYKSQGTGSGELDILLDNWFKPRKKNWRELLQSYLTTKYPVERDWKRRNRRYKIYMPSKNGKTLGDVAICVDTSGSMDHDEIATAIQHIQHLVGQVNPTSITFYIFDDGLQSVQKKVRGNTANLNKSVQLTGGGGTCIRETIDRVVADNTGLDLVFVITDGYLATDHAEELSKRFGFALFWLLTEENKYNTMLDNQEVKKILLLEHD